MVFVSPFLITSGKSYISLLCKGEGDHLERLHVSTFTSIICNGCYGKYKPTINKVFYFKFHFSYDSTFNILIASNFERSINFLGI